MTFHATFSSAAVALSPAVPAACARHEAMATERATAVRTALDHLSDDTEPRERRKAKALGTLLVSVWSQAVMAGLYDGDAS